MSTILIVEDEILIADRIAHYLQNSDVLPPIDIIGPAASYQEAVELAEKHKPDLALIDIRLHGPKSGIELAQYFRLSLPDTSYIFLTSQFGSNYLEEARALEPSGYLLKPIQRRSLCATVLLSLKPPSNVAPTTESITLYAGNKEVKAELKDLLFVEADHVYVNYHFADDIVVVVRQSLNQTEEILDETQFLRVHRGFIVNRSHITSHSGSSIRVGDKLVPISRSRSKEIVAILDSNDPVK